MTDREAFVAAVIAQPDDDVRRLVFADWLEEHGGEPERAEFIRVQVELAQIESAGWVTMPARLPGESQQAWELRFHRERDKRYQRRDELMPAARRIIDGNGSLWHWLKADGFPVGRWADWSWSGSEWETSINIYRDGAEVAGDRSATFTFRRGFVESVTCPADAWLAHGDAIVKAQPVRAVTLTTWPTLSLAWVTTSRDGNVWEIARWPGVTFTLPLPTLNELRTAHGLPTVVGGDVAGEFWDATG